MDVKYCVIDCDPGSDDVWALLMLLKAELTGRVKVVGVTCVSGNTSVDNACKNALRVLAMVNRLDIPVHKGAAMALMSSKPDVSNFYGADGFGDLELEPFDHTSTLNKQNAVEAMYQYARKYAPVTFILVGPLTNFALCLSTYEDFADNIKDVFIMGGNYKGVGNVTSSAEFNFYQDPEAAKIVLTKCKSMVNILPWEACLKKNFDISNDWRYKELPLLSNCPVVELLTRAEKVSHERNAFAYWCPADAMLVAAFLFPTKMIRKQRAWCATVEVNGNHTRGQMVLDHIQDPQKLINARIIHRIDSEFFKDVVLWTTGAKDPIDIKSILFK